MTNLDVLGPKESLIYISSIKKGMYLTSLVHKMTSFYSKGSMMIPFAGTKMYMAIGTYGNESIALGKCVWLELLII